MEQWLSESDAHRRSDLGVFLEVVYRSESGNLGRGCDNFISCGGFDIPEETEVRPLFGGTTLLPSGFAQGTTVEPFDQANISEEVGYSWLTGYEGGRHPFNGVTVPETPGTESSGYSWGKASRYNGLPAETGPLADMINAAHPLFVDLVEESGPNVFVRQLARLIRPTLILSALDQWLKEISERKDEIFRDYHQTEEGEGFGLIDAHRGALGHWIKVREGKISGYQVISPTSWNSSPRDENGRKGPWEQALIGTPVRDLSAPIEVEHVIRSFDPCLVCSVHCIDGPNFRDPGPKRITIIW